MRRVKWYFRRAIITAQLSYTVIRIPTSSVPITSNHVIKPVFPVFYNATKAANRPNKLAPVTPTRRTSAELSVAEAEAPVPVAVEDSEAPLPEAVEEPVAVAAESEPVAVLSEEESPVDWAGVPVDVK